MGKEGGFAIYAGNLLNIIFQIFIVLYAVLMFAMCAIININVEIIYRINIL